MFVRKAAIVILLLAGALAAGAQSLSPGNCFAAGGQCDASNTCLRFDVGRDGVLIETTLGTCDVPGPIIIGGGFDPPNPPPPPPFVSFVNTSRSGDTVVSAKDPDPKKGVPGGTKELVVHVTPINKQAQLTIQSTPNTGTAFFDSAGTLTTLPVNDGQKITIYGGAVSKKPRDMAITSTIGGKKVPGRFDFTVFRVDVTPFVSGSAAAALPLKEAKANSGRRLVVTNKSGQTVKLSARSMLAYYQDLVTVNGNTVTDLPDGKADDRFQAGQPDLDRVGHRHLDDVLAYGGIVMKGTIVPAGMVQRDFSPKIDPMGKQGKRESFNWVRNVDARDLIYKGTMYLRATICNQMLDDSTDNDEDLIPSKSGTIWVFDTPAYISKPVTGRDQLNEGETARGRYLFGERVEYADVAVSPIVWWHWKYSHTNPIGPKLFVQDNTVPGDNVVGIGPIPQPDCRTGK